jgi:hypothetical protein
VTKFTLERVPGCRRWPGAGDSESYTDRSTINGRLHYGPAFYCVMY